MHKCPARSPYLQWLAERMLSVRGALSLRRGHGQLQARTLGCHPPKALSERWPLHWAGCNFIPEDLHPKSFRGYFGHNTNVWAAANRKGLNVSALGAPFVCGVMRLV